MMGNRLLWVNDLKSLGRFDRAGSNPALGTKHKGVIPNRDNPFLHYLFHLKDSGNNKDESDQ